MRFMVLLSYSVLGSAAPCESSTEIEHESSKEFRVVIIRSWDVVGQAKVDSLFGLMEICYTFAVEK